MSRDHVGGRPPATGVALVAPSAMVALLAIIGASCSNEAHTGASHAVPSSSAAPAAASVAPTTAIRVPAPRECPAPPSGVGSLLIADDDESTTRGLAESVIPLVGPGSAKRSEDILLLTQPGPQHKLLNAICGLWDAPTKFWPAPGAQPIVSPGTSIRKMIMGGRFVYEDYEGSVFGRPFRGLGLTGYDNFKKVYTAMWIDTISTGIMTSTGTVDETGKVFTWNGEYHDPATGRTPKTHSQIRVLTEDTYVLELSFVPEDGREYKVFEVNYSRRK